MSDHKPQHEEKAPLPPPPPPPKVIKESFGNEQARSEYQKGNKPDTDQAVTNTVKPPPRK